MTEEQPPKPHGDLDYYFKLRRGEVEPRYKFEEPKPERPTWMREGEILFEKEEWRFATQLGVRLLECLGPQPQEGCQVCNPPRALLPSYDMTYELAKTIRQIRQEAREATKESL